MVYQLLNEEESYGFVVLVTRIVSSKRSALRRNRSYSRQEIAPMLVVIRK